MNMPSYIVALWVIFAHKLNTYILKCQNNTTLLSFFYVWPNSKLGEGGGGGDQPQVGSYFFGSIFHINDDIPRIIEFKERLIFILQLNHSMVFFFPCICNLIALDVNVESIGLDSSTHTTQLNQDMYIGLTIIATIIKFDFDDGWYSFCCRDCSKKDQGLQNIPDEFKILLNRKLVFKIQISLFNLENNSLTYVMHKLTDDESVLAKEKSDSFNDDNLEVVDLESLTPSSGVDKHHFLEPSSRNIVQVDRSWSNIDPLHHTDYLDSGDVLYVCSVCKAKVWNGEAIRGHKDLKKTYYSICCYTGKVELL
uniref:Uncharacterized protein n=1 Tax=Lactuca sativa TaxID=4236 RepID=A0A9R1XK98_LACSA|nr:hypothetical protein LSAT_V11C300153290 [Lactuca sativa]